MRLGFRHLQVAAGWLDRPSSTRGEVKQARGLMEYKLKLWFVKAGAGGGGGREQKKAQKLVLLLCWLVWSKTACPPLHERF